MTATQLKEAPKGRMADILKNGVPPETGAGEDPEELRLLALEIIMYDPDLAKKLIRSGLQKVLKENPTASG